MTLVIGGSRSGKSAFAQQLAARARPPVLFVATGTPSDAEMEARIAAHQRARPAAWQLLEAQRDVATAVTAALGDARTVLLDCLGLLVSSLIVTGAPRDAELCLDGPTVELAAQAEVEALVALAHDRGIELIVVSDEAGMGVVPPTPLGRVFRDALGRANQELAALADAVYLVVAGIPVELKALAFTLRRG